MPSHNVHRAFAEVIGLGNTEWSIYPDLDVIGLHRIKYHSLLNIDKLYKTVNEKRIGKVEDKEHVVLSVLSHVYLDQFSAPVFWQGFHPPAYIKGSLTFTFKRIGLTTIKDWLKIQKNILKVDLMTFNILKLYDNYLTLKYFGNLSRKEINKRIEKFKSEIEGKVPRDIFNHMLSSLVVHTPLRVRIKKVENKLSEFLGKNVKFKFNYDYKFDEHVRNVLEKVIVC